MEPDWDEGGTCPAAGDLEAVARAEVDPMASGLGVGKCEAVEVVVDGRGLLEGGRGLVGEWVRGCLGVVERYPLGVSGRPSVV